MSGIQIPNMTPAAPISPKLPNIGDEALATLAKSLELKRAHEDLLNQAEQRKLRADAAKRAAAAEERAIKLAETEHELKKLQAIHILTAMQEGQKADETQTEVAGPPAEGEGQPTRTDVQPLPSQEVDLPSLGVKGTVRPRSMQELLEQKRAADQQKILDTLFVHGEEAKQTAAAKPVARDTYTVDLGNAVEIREKGTDKVIEVRPKGKVPGSGEVKLRGLSDFGARQLAEARNAPKALDAIEKDIKSFSRSTGVGAQVGALMPNAATQMWGWGANAKKTLANIATVKQLIGKYLEGGVLRKEDEIKYKDILPVIGDAPDIAQSKIDGLRERLASKYDDQIQSYEDAGFDMKKFRSTDAKTGKKGDPLGLGL